MNHTPVKIEDSKWKKELLNVKRPRGYTISLEYYTSTLKNYRKPKKSKSSSRNYES